MKADLRRRLSAGLALAALALGPLTPAAGARQDSLRHEPTLSHSAPVTSRAGTVTGRVWHRDDTPVRNAKLQLRDLTHGQVVQRTLGDDLGRFVFTRVTPGEYIVELVDDGGSVLALGQMFAIGPVETVATFIRVGSAIPWYSGFFTNAAAAALSSAAALGVTALGNGGQPASARS